ncbi:hypothetical protein T265_08695 [Opisthorchis viverrini]|uniref:Uncharacterized protein n=1 Tax=Opisthorchis viverrini TaxID=6198 RepID=A0A074ZCR8_OPIVI|nr:hypothetical protein T265_08695 [Opisthorchis viverrini]KER23422.1 hypothetical protein T265_08695 [Opisthorchis viverrini]
MKQTRITFAKLHPLWRQKGISPDLEGRVYQAAVWAVLHDCLTWPLRTDELSSGFGPLMSQKRYWCWMASRLKHEVAWCSIFNCLRTSQTRDSAGSHATKCAAPARPMFQSLRYSRYHDTCIYLLPGHITYERFSWVPSRKIELNDGSREKIRNSGTVFRISVAIIVDDLCREQTNSSCRGRCRFDTATKKLSSGFQACATLPDWRVNRSSQPGQLLGRPSISRAHQSHRSSVNTFACLDALI